MTLWSFIFPWTFLISMLTKVNMGYRVLGFKSYSIGSLMVLLNRQASVKHLEGQCYCKHCVPQDSVYHEPLL